MAIQDKPTTPIRDQKVEAKPEPKSSDGSERPYRAYAPQRTWKQSVASPFAALFISVVLMVALLAYGLGATMTSRPGSATTNSGSTSGSSPGRPLAASIRCTATSCRT